MNVLMVGLDDSVFPSIDKHGNTTHRLSCYLDALKGAAPDSTLVDLIFTRHAALPFTPRSDLRFIPIKVVHSLFYPLAGLAAIYRWRKFLQPDIITVQNPFEIGLLGLAMRRILSAPIEVQVHLNLFSQHWLDEHRFLNRLRLKIGRYVLKRADAIRVVSKEIRSSLVQRWDIQPDRISVVPVPIIFEEPTRKNITNENIYPSCKHVLFVGRLCHAKNLPGLFTICEKLLEKQDSVKFTLIGDGPLRGYAHYQINRIGCDHFHLERDVPYNELSNWYKSADVLILPSLHEGFARVLVEGYLFDLPAVATRCGGPEDIIVDGDTGFLVAIEDVDTFAEKVNWLLEHPEDAKSMGRRGRTYVNDHFQPDTLIGNIIHNWLDTAANESRNL